VRSSVSFAQVLERGISLLKMSSSRQKKRAAQNSFSHRGTCSHIDSHSLTACVRVLLLRNEKTTSAAAVVEAAYINPNCINNSRLFVVQSINLLLYFYVRHADAKPDANDRKRRHSDSGCLQSSVVVGSQDPAIQAAETILSLSSCHQQQAATDDPVDDPVDPVDGGKMSISPITTTMVVEESYSMSTTPAVVNSVAGCDRSSNDPSVNEGTTVHQHDKLSILNVVSKHDVALSASRQGKPSNPAFGVNASDVYRFDLKTASPDVMAVSVKTGECVRRHIESRDAGRKVSFISGSGSSSQAR